MEKGLTKNEIIAQLARSEHGNLKAYAPITKQAAKEDPEFLAHLIAWNEINGQVRDTKVALPVFSFAAPKKAFEQFSENSFAHIAKLDPRNLERAWLLSKEVGVKGYRRQFRKLIKIYLRAREGNRNWFEKTALQHRGSLKSLYTLLHVHPNKMADDILFKLRYRKGSVFESIKNFKNMTDNEVASIIIKEEIPFLTLAANLGKRLKQPALLLSLIDQMSPTELITNTKMLTRLGVSDSAITRGAFEEALAKAATSKKTTFKATRAIEAVGDTKVKEKLKVVQEKQIQALGGVDGDWLVLGDRSGSMSACISLSKDVSATLAKMVKGKVHLIFFDTSPRHVDCTGKTYDQILAQTKTIKDGGSTSIGCGLQYCLDGKIEVDGIAIVSDGGENATPYFHLVYQNYCKKFDRDIPIYFYNVAGKNTALHRTLKDAKIDFQEFDLSSRKVDYYSLPNLVQTMHTNRYKLIDVVMNTKLLSLKDVFTDAYTKEW